MRNKGFTLIELLIVVAIIGILAAVGAAVIPNLLTNAKINCTTKQHKQIWDNFRTRIVQCSAGGKISYGPRYARTPSMITYDCGKTSVVADSHAYNMYLESRESQKNCYNTSISIFGTGSGSPGWSNGSCNLPNNIPLGQSMFGYQGGPWACGGSGDNACFKTNLGDKNGNDKFLYKTIDVCNF